MHDDSSQEQRIEKIPLFNSCEKLRPLSPPHDQRTVSRSIQRVARSQPFVLCTWTLLHAVARLCKSMTGGVVLRWSQAGSLWVDPTLCIASYWVTRRGGIPCDSFARKGHSREFTSSPYRAACRRTCVAERPPSSGTVATASALLRPWPSSTARYRTPHVVDEPHMLAQILI